jgi:hypothetical protein
MIANSYRFLQRLWRDERGAMAAVLTMLSTVVVGMTALTTDMGYLYTCQMKLQSAADAAALAGAQQLSAGASVAQAVAVNYSAGQGDLNTSKGFVSWMAPGYPQTECLSSTNVSCGSSGANAIVVKLNGRSPAFFGGIFGIASYNMAAIATAGSKGGGQGPVDVMIVLDTVGGSSLLAINPNLTDPVDASDPASLTDLPNAPCRMNTDATFARGILTYVLDIALQQCNPSPTSKINMALGGIQTFLGAMQPCSASLSTCGPATNGDVANPYVRVGLSVFPGFDNTTDAANTELQSGTCSMPLGTVIAPYWAPSPVYEVVPLSSDYRTSDSATSLNTSSNLGLAAGAGGCGAMAVNPIMGGVLNQVSRGVLYGSFYASAITAAQAALTNEGRPGVRKVIIFVSDGNADALSQVIGANVTAGGSGYTAGANVTITGGMGSGATGVATVVNGVITGINITNPGSGYSAVGPPTISITPKNAVVIAGVPIGGSGTGAAAVVTLNPGVNQCHQGMAAAQAAQAAGTTIYSVGYFASSYPLLSCLTDILPVLPLLSAEISACQAMTAIASDPSKFYSVNVPTGGLLNGAPCQSTNSANSLNAIFAAIANDIGGARILPNGTA